VLTEARNRPGVQRSSWPGLLQVVSVLLDSMGRRVECLRWCHGGQGGSEIAGGEESGRRPCYPQRRFGAIPVMQRRRLGVEVSRSFTGRWRSYCGARGGWCYSGAAWARWCRGPFAAELCSVESRGSERRERGGCGAGGESRLGCYGG